MTTPISGSLSVIDPSLLDSLTSLLEQEDAIYGEMAVLLGEEREAMLRLNVTRLGEITSRKETLTLRIKALDESRKMLARRLAQILGLSPAHITITALCAAAPGAATERLRLVADRLRDTVITCQVVNRHNALAASRGMELAQGVMEHLIEQADPGGKVYAAPRGKGYPAPTRGGGASGFISRQA